METVRPAFQFCEADHTYTLNGGYVVPSCTTALSHCGLADFSQVDQQRLARKSLLGKAVHRARHLYDIDDLLMESLDAETKGYLDGYIDFRKQTGFAPELSEHQCIGEIDGLEFGMTIDLSGNLGREAVIIDTKISQALYWWNEFQIAGYCAGLPHPVYKTSLARFVSRVGYILQLRPDATWKLSHPMRDRRCYDGFAAALRVTALRFEHGQVPQLVDRP